MFGSVCTDEVQCMYVHTHTHIYSAVCWGWCRVSSARGLQSSGPVFPAVGALDWQWNRTPLMPKTRRLVSVAWCLSALGVSIISGIRLICLRAEDWGADWTGLYGT